MYVCMMPGLSHPPPLPILWYPSAPAPLRCGACGLAWLLVSRLLCLPLPCGVVLWCSPFVRVGRHNGPLSTLKSNCCVWV